MTAGSVAVPTIVPLKAPGSGTTGSRKWMIDTGTLVELHSNTKECLLFYTLDGSKPDPFKKIGERTTYQYLEPFTLKAGKRTVKAVAILRDGSKESSVNTKVFQVEIAEENSDDNEDLLNTTWEKKIMKEEKSKVERSMFKKVIPNSSKEIKKDPKSVVERVMTDSTPEQYVYDPRVDSNQMEDLMMRCLRCNTIRPSDRYARFCHGCSASLPPPPGGMRSPVLPIPTRTFPCEHCNSMLPVDALFCSACETNVRVSHKKNLLKNTCLNCGTKNPPETSVCIVCEVILQKGCLPVKEAPNPSSDFVICPLCTRINSANARFCDWCGKRPLPATATTSCQRCFVENVIDAKFCCSCGKTMLPPTRKEFQETLQRGEVAVKSESGSVKELIRDASDNNHNWKTIPFQPVARRRSKNVAVQVGDDLESSFSKISLKPDSKASPGKGYWRQQLQHIIQHLKVYAQNNIEFRDNMSSQVLMGLISSSGTNNEEESMFTLTLTFAAQSEHNAKKNIKNSKSSGTTLINALSTNSKFKNGNGSRPSSARSRPSSAVNSRPTSGSSRPGSGRKNKKVTQKSLGKEKIAAKLAKLSDTSLQLLNMIKSSKQLNPEKVQDLIDADDTDINLKDENDIPLLKLCVLNKHFDILQLILNAGIDVNQTSAIKETTALHEAVFLGIQGREAVEVLLDNGASPDVKDKKGKTPYDHALDTGSEGIVSKFTKHMKSDLLKDVVKL